MVTRYAIIQYVPNPLADERINIGAVVWGEGGIRVAFVRDWDRVQAFAGQHQDIGFLKDFANEFPLVLSGRLPLLNLCAASVNSRRLIVDLAPKWANCVQVTPPRASLVPVDDVLSFVLREFLGGVGAVLIEVGSGGEDE